MESLINEAGGVGLWLHAALRAVVLLLAAALAHSVGHRIVRRLAGRQPLLSHVVERAVVPSRWVLFAFAMQIAVRNGPDTLPGIETVRHMVSLFLIFAVTWLAVNGVRAVAEAIVDRHPADIADNLNARRIRTQTNVLARGLMFLAALLGTAAALMTFPGVREFGASLLASAGVAGLVVGFAAKPVLSNLLAGLQIAMTQPIRLDDVVIVEGEWGRIEEITSAYVVVRIWDDRRLIVPLNWFIEHPFQNWTRRTSQLLGTVFLWVDYSTPLEPLRREARRICEATEEWDRRVCLIQVTDANDRAVQLRVLVSANDSSQAWDLRCEVREKLIAFVQKEYPSKLPMLRAAISNDLLQAEPQ